MLFKVTLTVSELLFVIQEELEGLSQRSTYVFPSVPMKLELGSVLLLKLAAPPENMDHSPLPTAFRLMLLKQVDVSFPALKSLNSLYSYDKRETSCRVGVLCPVARRLVSK